MQMQRIGWAFSGVVAGLLAAGTPSAVSAQSFIRAYAQAYDQNTGSNVSDTGQIAGPLATAESGPFADFGGTFHAKAFAQLTPGMGPMLGSFSAMTNTYPLFQSIALAKAWWSEVVTIGGTPGTQVSFNLGFRLSDTLTAAIYPGYANNLGAQAEAQFDGTGALSGLSIHDDYYAPAAIKTVWRTMTFNAGDIVTFGASLYTIATAQGAEATADAYSTGLFAMKLLTPGGGYTTDNGLVFLTSFDALPPVPEPATWALLIAGCGLLVASLRRRRRMGAPD